MPREWKGRAWQSAADPARSQVLDGCQRRNEGFAANISFSRASNRSLLCAQGRVGVGLSGLAATLKCSARLLHPTPALPYCAGEGADQLSRYRLAQIQLPTNHQRASPADGDGATRGIALDVHISVAPHFAPLAGHIVEAETTIAALGEQRHDAGVDAAGDRVFRHIVRRAEGAHGHLRAAALFLAEHAEADDAMLFGQ